MQNLYSYPPQTQYSQNYQSYYQLISAKQQAAAAQDRADNALCLVTFGLLFGILAVVQAVKQISLGYSGGKAAVGIALGIIGMVGWRIVIIAVIAQLSY